MSIPLTLCFGSMILDNVLPTSLSPRVSLSPGVSLSPPPLVRYLTSPSLPILQARPIPCLQYLEPYQQFSTCHQCLPTKLKEFNDMVEWHQQNAINGNPIPINMLFLMSLIDPIHKLYKRDNNSIQNWCFRDIYLATFGTQPMQSPPVPEPYMTKMYIDFYNSVIYK